MLFVMILFDANAQESIVTLSQYPTLDKLLEQKWTYEFERSDLSMYSKWPIVENGILFAHFDMSYVVDLSTGDQWRFADAQYREKITSRLNDSLLVYDLLDKVVIKNICESRAKVEFSFQDKCGGDSSKDMNDESFG